MARSWNIVRNLFFFAVVWWGVSALVVAAGAEEFDCCGNGPIESPSVFRLTAGGAANGRTAPVDVRGKLQSFAAKPGLNLVDQNGGMKLYGRYEQGRFVEFIIVDAHGKTVPSQVTRRADAKGKTTCWQCGKGEDGGTHCWVIPCPVITGPWTPGSVKAIR